LRAAGGEGLADRDDVAVDVEGGVGLPGLEPGTAAVDGLLAVVAAVAGAGGLSPVLSGDLAVHRGVSLNARADLGRRCAAALRRPT